MIIEIKLLKDEKIIVFFLNKVHKCCEEYPKSTCITKFLEKYAGEKL